MAFECELVDFAWLERLPRRRKAYCRCVLSVFSKTRSSPSRFRILGRE